MERNNTSKKYKKKISKWSKLFKTPFNKSDKKNFSYDQRNSITWKTPLSKRGRRSIRNRLISSSNNGFNHDYSVWEYSYFTHLMNIRNIFLNGLDGYLDIDNPLLTEKIFKFIWDSSTGEISIYEEELNEEMEEIYSAYLKKKNLYNKDINGS